MRGSVHSYFKIQSGFLFETLLFHPTPTFLYPSLAVGIEGTDWGQAGNALGMVGTVSEQRRERVERQGRELFGGWAMGMEGTGWGMGDEDGRMQEAGWGCEEAKTADTYQKRCAISEINYYLIIKFLG